MDAKVFRIVACSIVLLVFSFYTSVFAQEEDAEDSSGFIGELSIGSLKTEGEKAALAVGAALKNKLPIGQPKEFVVADRMYHRLVPAFDITQTEDDQFERISAGLEGFTLISDSLIIPYSTGIEASRNFESYAGIIEVGFAPGLRPKDTFLGTVQRTLFADAPPLTLQAGYKFQEATNRAEDSELQRDESGEDEDEALVRLRIAASLNTDNHQWIEDSWLGWLLGSSPDGDIVHISAKGQAALWYSVVADEIHDVESLSLEIYSPQLETVVSWLKDKRIELSYQWGSGAPTFNKGEFFTAAIKMKL